MDLALDPLLRALLRAGLAVLFGASAVHKLRDLDGFRRVLRGYALLPERAVLRAEPLDLFEEPLGLGHLGRGFLGLRLGTRLRTEKQHGGKERCGQNGAGSHTTSRVIRAAF